VFGRKKEKELNESFEEQLHKREIELSEQKLFLANQNEQVLSQFRNKFEEQLVSQQKHYEEQLNDLKKLFHEKKNFGRSFSSA